MLERIDSLRSRSWAWFDARAHGPHGIFWLSLLSFLEPIVSPIVPETLMVAMLLSRPEHWKRYALITAFFSFLGGVCGFWLGWFLFTGIGDWVLSFYGLEAWFARAQELFAGNVFVVMLLITFTPIPDKVFVLMAGFLRVPFLQYAAGFLAGRTLRFFIVAYVTHRFGGKVIELVNRYFAACALAAGAVLVFFILRQFGAL